MEEASDPCELLQAMKTPETGRMTLAGIILCGGESRRMGRDKAWLPFGNETMLQRVVRIVGEVCEPVVVVAGPKQALPTLPVSTQVVRDADEYLGPVAGSRAGLEAVSDDRPIFLCGCDMPFVSDKLIRFLAQRYRPGYAVVPVIDGVRQPLAAIYPNEVRSGTDLQSLQQILEKIPRVEIEEAELRQVDPDLKSFVAINDPEAYAAAEARRG
ncbi:MAG: molybdenum cofactor guanylyltransferase [Gemmataceae bacterium]